MSKPSALMKETSKSLEEAIDANVNLQNEILAKLICISKAKQQNRKQSLELTTALFDHIHHHNHSHTSTSRSSQGNNSDHEEELNSNGDESDAERSQKKKGDKQKKAKKTKKAAVSVTKRKSLWSDNPERKWKRRFFVDPDGSIPKPNDDVIQRRIWEGMLAGPDIHRFVPWSKEEIKLLLKYAEEVKNEQIQELSDRQQHQQQQQQQHINRSRAGAVSVSGSKRFSGYFNPKSNPNLNPITIAPLNSKVRDGYGYGHGYGGTIANNVQRISNTHTNRNRSRNNFHRLFSIAPDIDVDKNNIVEDVKGIVEENNNDNDNDNDSDNHDDDNHVKEVKIQERERIEEVAVSIGDITVRATRTKRVRFSGVKPTMDENLNRARDILASYNNLSNYWEQGK
mmetsp:Transcript_9444/g.13662  ORF Transcript_9444/g.13662 Transcript_9444/m.13662 type:complete len:397 (-) Transcript_9444:285-1475(-)